MRRKTFDLMLAAAWLLAVFSSPASEVEPTTAATPAISLSEFQTNSPRFRGWDGGGYVPGTNFTLSWDDSASKGILWKSPIPLAGYSSPVVWGDRVFVSGGTVRQREVFCFHAGTGVLLWRNTIPDRSGIPPKEPEMPEATGIAACTTATDGRRLYVIFGNADVAALDFAGALVWSKSLGPLKNSYGHASSLAIWQDTIFAQLDAGETHPADSRLVAVEGATGRVLWTRSRLVPISWATPIVIDAAGHTQLITLAQPWVISYSTVDGHEFWRAELLDNEIVPSPIFAGGLIIAASPSVKLLALRPDGTGDVTKTGVAWIAPDNTPDTASPVSNGELVFTVTSGGDVTCFDLRNGQKIWEHDLALSVQSSPAIAGNRLFLLTEKGIGIVLEAGREFRELARSKFVDQFFASPAFANGRVFLRGQTNLYCLGEASAKLKASPSGHQ